MRTKGMPRCAPSAIGGSRHELPGQGVGGGRGRVHGFLVAGGLGAAVKCVMCGRSLSAAAVLIGQCPVGPVCARRAGLIPLAAKRAGLVKPGPVFKRHASRQELAQLDLFSEVAP